MHWEEFTSFFSLSSSDRLEQMSYGDHTKLQLQNGRIINDIS